MFVECQTRESRERQRTEREREHMDVSAYGKAVERSLGLSVLGYGHHCCSCYMRWRQSMLLLLSSLFSSFGWHISDADNR